MRYFVVAGEASGDLHGSALVRALKLLDSDAEVQGWGGDKMSDAGAKILKHYQQLDFMGFVEVAKNLPTILGNFRTIKAQITGFQPDALVLIDYPGFNLRLTKWAKKKAMPVHYYISPQVWAWQESRVETIRNCVDRMYVILPFERDFYGKHDMDVTYVGHPLLEQIERFRAESPKAQGHQNLVAILAGSRIQEIKHVLPTMLTVASTFTHYDFCIAAPSHIPLSLYESQIAKAGADNVQVRRGETYDVLNNAYAAMTTSGTATLETALFGVPQVVCYKGNALSFEIAKRLVRVPYISLVNLIADHPVVEELIQGNVNTKKLSDALERLLDDDHRRTMLADYDTLHEDLDQGGASALVAQSIVKALTTST